MPLYEQLARELRKLIASGELKAGEQLPSVQSISAQLNISVSTVRQSLSQLTADGWLSSQQGTRAKVSLKLPATSIATASTCIEEEPLGLLDLENNEGETDELSNSNRWTKRMQSAFEETPFYARYDEFVEIDFRAGKAPTEALSGTAWQNALTRWSARCIDIPRGHNNPAGMPELRKRIAKWIYQQRNIGCDEENIFIVSGAQQARNLIARLFVDEGTSVAFEDPGSNFAKLSFQSYGAEIHPISVDGSGIIPTELTESNESSPSLLYLTPSAQFPTGSVLSKSRRIQIADWAKANEVIIVEDDNNCEFTYESRQSPAVFSYAPDHCIYIGTFSQLLDPAWRIAFLLVPDRMRDVFFRSKWLADRCTSPLVQTLLLELIETGFLKRHLKKSQSLCEKRRAALLAEISRMPKHLINFTPTKGGLNQAIWLPASTNDIEVFQNCFELGLGVLPISPYFSRQPAPPGILMSFSGVSNDKIAEGVRRLQTVLGAAYGA